MARNRELLGSGMAESRPVGPAPAALGGGTRLTGPSTIADRWSARPVILRGRRGHWPPPSTTSRGPGALDAGHARKNPVITSAGLEHVPALGAGSFRKL